MLLGEMLLNISTLELFGSPSFPLTRSHAYSLRTGKSHGNHNVPPHLCNEVWQESSSCVSLVLFKLMIMKAVERMGSMNQEELVLKYGVCYCWSSERVPHIAEFYF